MRMPPPVPKHLVGLKGEVFNLDGRVAVSVPPVGKPDAIQWMGAITTHHAASSSLSSESPARNFSWWGDLPRRKIMKKEAVTSVWRTLAQLSGDRQGDELH